MHVLDETVLIQVERIIRSDAFQNSDALRRLLKYLADKSVSGQADQLKEYTIGLEAFGKPPSYDPRHDSIVRLQAGRLRQKLAEFYRTEGKDDPTIIELPKGRFKLTFEQRAPQGESGIETPAKARGWTGKRRALEIAVMLLLFCIGWAASSTVQSLAERKKSAGSRPPGWTPALEQLWRPFLFTNRPLIVAVEDPLFVELKGTETYYRDKSLNRWSDVQSSNDVAAIRKAFKNIEIEPRYYYTDFGEVDVAFGIGRLLSLGQQNITFARSSLIYWQQLADNNILFVGAPWFFDEQLAAMPIQQELIQDRDGTHILHPKPGEPSILRDRLPTGIPEDGEVYALVTHTSGPLGTTDVESITSNRTPGRVGAIKWFTDPALAQAVVAQMRNPSGEIPRYYQLVLKVKFKDGVPTDTTYVLHRELQFKKQSSE